MGTDAFPAGGPVREATSRGRRREPTDGLEAVAERGIQLVGRVEAAFPRAREHQIPGAAESQVQAGPEPGHFGCG